MDVYSHLYNKFDLEQLKAIIKEILPNVDTTSLNKANLCEIISNDYEDYKLKRGSRNCINAGIIEDDYLDIPDSQVVSFTQDKKLYCLTLEEFGRILEENKINPFNRLPIPESAIKQYDRKMKLLAPQVNKIKARQLLQQRLK
jgi:hypothetical protein